MLECQSARVNSRNRVSKVKTDSSNFRRDAIIPTLETHAQLYDGVRYDELPIVHIKATLNNTIMTLSNHNGKCVGLIFWWLMKLPYWFKVTFFAQNFRNFNHAR